MFFFCVLAHGCCLVFGVSSNVHRNAYLYQFQNNFLSFARTFDIEEARNNGLIFATMCTTPKQRHGGSGSWRIRSKTGGFESGAVAFRGQMFFEPMISESPENESLKYNVLALGSQNLSTILKSKSSVTGFGFSIPRNNAMLVHRLEEKRIESIERMLEEMHHEHSAEVCVLGLVSLLRLPGRRLATSSCVTETPHVPLAFSLRNSRQRKVLHTNKLEVH